MYNSVLSPSENIILMKTQDTPSAHAIVGNSAGNRQL